MIRKLRRKFVLINMLLVSLILLVVFVGIYVYDLRRHEVEGDFTLHAVLGQADGQPPPLPQLGGEIPNSFLRDPVFLVATQESGETELVFSNNIDITETDAAHIADEALSAGQSKGVLRAYNLRYLIKTDEGDTKIAFMELSYEQGQIRTTVRTSLFAGIVGLGAFFVVSLYLSKWALRPVEQAWTQQRRFISDASHELKTPLTVILANTGILKTRPDKTVGSQMDWVESTEKQAGRMKGLVEDLLFLARSDEAVSKIVYSELNLSDLIQKTALAFEPVAFDRGIELVTKNDSGIHVAGDESQLVQLTGILLDNAVKYSEGGGEVHISLESRQSQAVLMVRNTGNPIDPEDIPHLFDRFYRADEARSDKGYGLGLSIAKSIVDSHKGEIMVESNRQTGTVFTVFLPLC